jgi:hypothetical protein
LDFSHSLVHLTRERKEYSSGDFTTQKLVRVVSAFEVLKEILASGMLRGSGNEGFVKGKHRAVCFSEIPLSAMHQFAEPPEVDTARYRNYGIVISKDASIGFLALAHPKWRRKGRRLAVLSRSSLEFP